MGRKRHETPADCTRNAQALPLEWGAYILRPTDPKCSVRDLPNYCGIYGWWSKEGDLLYVGRSRTMRSRMREHHMPSMGGRMLSYRLVPERWLGGVEMAHVKTLEPFHNCAEEGAGLPFWDAMCAAIGLAWRDVLPGMLERVRAADSALNEQIAARL